MHPKVQELEALLRRREKPAEEPGSRISSGCGPLDGLLPGRGFLPGSLVEWLGDGPGCGAGMLALRAASQACRSGGALVVIDPGGRFYPPAAAACGVDLRSTIVVRVGERKSSLWALDQALRCSHVAAVMAWPPLLESRAFRRLQLAAETSGALGLLIRDATVRREASWADTRLLISPAGRPRHRDRPPPAVSSPTARSVAPLAGVDHDEPLVLSWRLRIELLRCRGGATGRVVDLEIDERTGDIHATHPGNLAAQLADSAVDSRQARA